jgi:CheY-like chemotaxis protein
VNQQRLILIADDDENDVLILTRALKKIGIGNPVRAVEDGVEAIAYLKGEGKYQDRTAFPLPGLIITDLKMPKVNGFEFLQWQKTQPTFSAIPSIVLSGSALRADITRAYELRANCYLQKPGTAAEFERMLQVLFDFWRLCKLAG